MLHYNDASWEIFYPLLAKSHQCLSWAITYMPPFSCERCNYRLNDCSPSEKAQILEIEFVKVLKKSALEFLRLAEAHLVIHIDRSITKSPSRGCFVVYRAITPRSKYIQPRCSRNVRDWGLASQSFACLQTRKSSYNVNRSWATPQQNSA